jgi:hypothetical protein
MGKRGINRYSLLSDDQKKAIQSIRADLIFAVGLNSFTGPPDNLPYFQKSFHELKALLTGWVSAKLWVTAFVYWSNSTAKKSKRTYSAGVSSFKNGFYKFVTNNGYADIPLHEFTVDHINEFENWLRTDEGKAGNKNSIFAVRAPETNRRGYGLVKSWVEELNENVKHIGTQLIPANSIFKTKAFPPGPPVRPTNVLSDVEYGSIFEAAYKSALRIRQLVEGGWNILTGPPVHPELSRKGRGKYRNFSAALWALHLTFPDPVMPSLEMIESANKDLADALHYLHRLRNVYPIFEPSARNIFPFVVLLSFYSQANTGPLRGLKLTKIRFADVFGTTRVTFEFGKNILPETIEGVERVIFEFQKERIHSSYLRSYVVDGSDPLSPSEIVKFLTRWTERIRSVATIHKDSLILFRDEHRGVRGFYTVKLDGQDSDSSWLHVLKKFIEENKLPKFNISELRMTGLHIVNDIFDNDILAKKVAAGHKEASSTIKQHYEGAGEKRRHEESLAEVGATMERWVDSKGKSHVRGAPKKADLGAATPGWHCVDPYSSPIPGEVKGRLCQGFGRCPACYLALLDNSSAYSLARALQLMLEIQEARFYLPFARWDKVFRPVKEVLQKRWLPSFVDPDVIVKARMLNLAPIGRLD